MLLELSLVALLGLVIVAQTWAMTQYKGINEGAREEQIKRTR